MSGIPLSVLWLLPGLFLMHDLEETLCLPPWLRRNRARLEIRFPALTRRLLPRLDRISRLGFAAMAAEELLLLVAATLWAQNSGNCYPWLALFLAFGIHLFVHLGQWLALRCYVPVVATSLAGLPVVGWMVREIINSRTFSVREWILCGAVGVVVAAANLLLLHRVAARITR